MDVGCLAVSSWCQKNWQQDCGYGIGTTDPKICRNMTFWKKVPCPAGYQRCNGDFPGQCALRDLKCLDGSDQLEPLPSEGDCGEKLKCKPMQNPVGLAKTDEVCLDKKLVCDLHPQCQGGEDELREECNEVYLEKKIFTKDQTFICPNPYYNVLQPDGQTKKLFTHRAIRCNSDPECWGGEDEEGCNIVEATAQYVIRKLRHLMHASVNTKCIELSFSNACVSLGYRCSNRDKLDKEAVWERG